MAYSFNDVAAIVAERFKINQDTIAPDSEFEDLCLDSLSLIELALTISKKIGVKISDEDIAEVENMNELVELLNGV